MFKNNILFPKGYLTCSISSDDNIFHNFRIAYSSYERNESAFYYSGILQKIVEVEVA